MKYILRIIKVNAIGGRDIIEIPLPNIDDLLTPSEMLDMEIRLNSGVTNLRFHLETRE